MSDKRRPQSASVIICCYNHARYLDGAIRSAVGQTWEHTQVVVVDDGSTDNTPEILTKWESRITVIRQRNGGQSSAYNTGFDAATGDIVIFLDADDFLMPSAVATLMRVFGEDERLVRVGFGLQVVDARDNHAGRVIPTYVGDDTSVPAFRRYGYLYPASPGSGNAYARSSIGKLFPLPIDQSDKHGADFFTVYGSGLIGSIRSIPDVLGAYRADSHSAEPILTFGNAASDGRELARTRARMRRFREWIRDRTGEVLPEHSNGFISFSLTKGEFASAIFGHSKYSDGFRSGLKQLAPLLSSIQLHPALPAKSKIALYSWACIVLIAPRKLGLPLARYVCNPGWRGSSGNAAKR